MSKTFTESRNLKQKAVKSFKRMLETIKKNLNAKINYIDYIHVCKVKNTQSKKLCNLLLNNIGNISKTSLDPDKVIFQVIDFKIMRSHFCVKGQVLLFPPKH